MSTFGKREAGDLVSLIESRLDRRRFQDQHWEGSFQEYLEICEKNPGVVRNAYQRLYDAILSHGHEKYKLFKKECVRYHFFSDPFDNGADAIFEVDIDLVGVRVVADFATRRVVNGTAGPGGRSYGMGLSVGDAMKLGDQLRAPGAVMEERRQSAMQ
jgi:hypothetical protein